MSETPVIALTNALGAAYSSLVAGHPRSAIIGELREALAAKDVKPIVPGYLAQLEGIVTARTSGNRCGCHISQTQLSLLAEATQPAA